MLRLSQVNGNWHFCFFFQFLVLFQCFVFATVCITPLHVNLGLDLVLQRRQFTRFGSKFNFEVLLNLNNLALGTLEASSSL